MSQQPLDYQASSATARRTPAQRLGAFALWLLAGVAATPVAMFLAIASGGAGHGDYGFARLCFPYSMLLTLLTGNEITRPLITLAAAQFPAYGLLIGLGAVRTRRAFKLTAAAVGVCHALAAAVCFSGVLPNFS